MSPNEEIRSDEVAASSKLGDSGCEITSAVSLPRKAEPQLKDIAERANRKYRTAKDQLQSFLGHARDCGHELNHAKQLVPHGEWGKWGEANFEGSDRLARHYMFLDANWHRISDLDLGSLGEAIATIRFLKSSPDSCEDELGVMDDETPPFAELESNKGETPEMPAAQVMEAVATVERPPEPLQVTPCSKAARIPVATTAKVIAILEKRIETGPTEAVREEIRVILAFCRDRISRLPSPLIGDAELPLF
ncbi:DUF3102 domain-containing protein [Haloferula sp. BvORR071]|uniref:DUF3102 domain-containing protein n=1 Tax=Haloferula sp. BvORR071 TaxID=1396141 RepID=UPI000552B078|nr:DUF3102 domain-containing protein [Haloferula sp. BvORR071]